MTRFIKNSWNASITESEWERETDIAIFALRYSLTCVCKWRLSKLYQKNSLLSCCVWTVLRWNLIYLFFLPCACWLINFAWIQFMQPSKWFYWIFHRERERQKSTIFIFQSIKFNQQSFFLSLSDIFLFGDFYHEATTICHFDSTKKKRAF